MIKYKYFVPSVISKMYSIGFNSIKQVLSSQHNRALCLCTAQMSIWGCVRTQSKQQCRPGKMRSLKSAGRLHKMEIVKETNFELNKSMKQQMKKTPTKGCHKKGGIINHTYIKITCSSKQLHYLEKFLCSFWTTPL